MIPDCLSFRVVRFRLESLGFFEIEQMGNHVKFIKREQQNKEIKTVILPHYTDLAGSVVASAARQAGLSLLEFLLL